MGKNLWEKGGLLAGMGLIQLTVIDGVQCRLVKSSVSQVQVGGENVQHFRIRSAVPGFYFRNDHQLIQSNKQQSDPRYINFFMFIEESLSY